MKHRVVKFVELDQCVSKQQTQTGNVLDDDDDDFVHANRHTQAKGDPKSPILEPVAGSSSYPRRERKSPAYLGDYVTVNDLEDEDDDQVV